jgi:hypothetical protein
VVPGRLLAKTGRAWLAAGMDSMLMGLVKIVGIVAKGLMGSAESAGLPCCCPAALLLGLLFAVGFFFDACWPLVFRCQLTAAVALVSVARTRGGHR